MHVYMCFERGPFTNYQAYNNQKLVYLWDNSTHKIWAQGDIIIALLWYIKHIYVVFYVPGLRKNLFLVKQFDKVGGELHIKSGICTLTNQSREMIGKCIFSYDLYRLGVTTKPNQSMTKKLIYGIKD